MPPRTLRYALVPLPFALTAAALTILGAGSGRASPSPVPEPIPTQAADAAPTDGGGYDSILQFIDAPWPDGGDYNRPGPRPR